MPVGHMLRRLVQRGQLTMIEADGRRQTFGHPGGLSATMRFHTADLPRKMFLRPSIAFGEAYTDGTLTVEDGSLETILTIIMDNMMQAPTTVFTPLLGGIDRALRRLQQFNPVARSRRNVAHHYDLSDQLYELFLDSDRQYSCAYYPTGSEDLEQAQQAKKLHIAAKLLIEPGMRVLDIGSGWGGLALDLARTTGADVTGLTLSVEQHAYATRRAVEAGLADRVRFHLSDYREAQGQYDRIVSIGMFEHVGVDHFPQFFRTLRALLQDDGVALIHAIGRQDGPGATNAWIRKNIFPGGYCPALSEVFPHLERSGLWMTDTEILRLHYARTLRQWRQRFMANWDRAAALYDERFCRMWEFYLTACEVSFKVQGMMVFQIQMAPKMDTVPLTRDYIHEFETRSRASAATTGSAANVA